MANLEYSEAIGRLIRIGESDGQIGRSTLLEAYDAIDAGDVTEAKRLLESFRSNSRSSRTSMSTGSGRC